MVMTNRVAWRGREGHVQEFKLPIAFIEPVVGALQCHFSANKVVFIFLLKKSLCSIVGKTDHFFLRRLIIGEGNGGGEGGLLDRSLDYCGR